nr:hypothetical protein [Tanacetum cinerariifolium]
MEEIDLFLNPDDPLPSGIEEDDDDSERDSLILEELLDNYPLSLPATESYHFDIPSPYRPPAKPPDVTARDEKWFTTKERVKISTTNVRLEVTVSQKEETFQVIIDVIKNSVCNKEFTISAKVPKIFRKILDICPRVQGVEFT